MFDDDVSYYQHRAEIEVERAQQATSPEVVRVHHQLAEAYLDRLAAGRFVVAEAS